MKEVAALGVGRSEEDVARVVRRARKHSAREATGKAGDADEIMKDYQIWREEYEEKLRELDKELLPVDADVSGEQDAEAAAEEFLALSSLKVQRARDPEENKKLRSAMRMVQRQMKGVKLQYSDDDVVLFDDVAGIGDVKVELMEVVDFFLKPERFRASGAKIPRGVLLHGPPGTGKTLLARAVAGEAGVAFLSVNASEFVEIFIGVGASRVRDLFKQARSLSPAVIFIDEVDAVGRVRGISDMANSEREATLNQLLLEMDGFGTDARTIVIAATNRLDILDPALVRPGRFDRVIKVPVPDYQGRIDILNVHMRKVPHNPARVDYPELASVTQRFSGAQLANLVNTAALIATREEATEITMEHLLTALTYEQMGAYKPPYTDSRQDRLAVQEAATALVASVLPALEAVQFATILPREKQKMGQTGVKVSEARNLNNLFTRTYLEAQLQMVLAGRAAEEMVYGREEMSSINQRRLIMARRLACKLLLSGALTDDPAFAIAPITQTLVSGRQQVQVVDERVSAATLARADQQLVGLIGEHYDKVTALLKRNRPALDALINALKRYNYLSGEKVQSIVADHAAKGDLIAMITGKDKLL